MGQPHGVRAAGGILGHGGHDRKTVRGEKGAGVVRVEARVVERLAEQGAHRHPGARAGGEHERRAGRGVIAGPPSPEGRCPTRGSERGEGWALSG